MAKNAAKNAAKTANDQPDTVDFGFAEVPRRAKEGLVSEIFSDVAPRYDLMNDLMSLGLHRLWKSALIDRLRPRPGMVLVDVAGGTGDVARAFAEHLARRETHSLATGGSALEGRAVVCDINFKMTQSGRDRAIDKPIAKPADAARPVPIDWICGNAEDLPLASAIGDAATIAFGLRNVTDRAAVLAEMHRVLKPGGQMLVLEFSRVSEPALAALYDRYSFSVLPRLGAAVAGNRDAYLYLAESIRRFPDPDTLQEEIEAAGFGRTGHQLLTGGIAAIHTGWRV
ncbi:MAG: class I SAM-dependent methyltransferase [Alphaproteobacteria bacterium]|nr:class I SAM-dependent methyltransferase [Alphaproteobacteria bacterium]